MAGKGGSPLAGGADEARGANEAEEAAEAGGAAASAALVCLGAIAGAFGVRGEVRLKPFTAAPEDIAAYGPVRAEDGARAFEIRLTRPIKGGLAARLSGVATREDAEALRGTRLFVDRSALPESALDEDEYYHADLIGLTVEDLSGTPLGRVVAVQDFGAGDMLEIRPPRGKSAYLPFTRAAAPHVDLSAGRIVADPPEGLFDEADAQQDEGGPEEEGSAAGGPEEEEGA